LLSCSDTEQEDSVTNGEYLYLAMVIGSFTLFGVVLAYTAELEERASRRAARKADRPQ